MGIQIIGPVHGEMDCLQLAFAYQEARKGELARVPPLVKKAT
jgi:Asp-tRNA(Asn)/Glu-tRNA(Gln) amidotransferase A subunit family amidase